MSLPLARFISPLVICAAAASSGTALAQPADPPAAGDDGETTESEGEPAEDEGDGEVGDAEAGAGESGAAETGAAETGAAETGAAEADAAESGTAESGAGAAEAGAAEAGGGFSFDAAVSEAEEKHAGAVPGGRAVPPPPPPSSEPEPEFHESFVLDTGRTMPAPPEADLLRLQFHGQYQARYTQLSDLPLVPFRDDPSTNSLGHTNRLTHWLRFTPRLTIGKNFAVIAQADLVRGFIAGQETVQVDSTEPDYEERQPVKFSPRWLYLEWLTPVGLLRVGQQPQHWGMGILANDGDHPTLFGDYEGGTIVERVLFATKPFGRDTGFNVALAGDVVFKDNTVDITKDELAIQGVLAMFYSDRDPTPYNDLGRNSIGLFGVLRHQEREAFAVAGDDFDETLDVLAVSSAGEFNAAISGSRGHVFGAYEVAYLHGDTNYVRTTALTRDNEREQIRALGAAAKLGFVKTRGEADERWGELAVQMKWGWASGDANPNDGTTRRFTFDPNFNVGLILFDEVLKWKTARAANIARDPDLTNRPQPGVDLLPTDGAITGATFLYPTVVYRPVRQLDLKAAAVLAQTTADFVDPVFVGTNGRFRNYDRGDATARDLGLELDAGIEYRLALDYDMTLQLGAQGGVFFPGGAFDGVDAAGNATSMDTQYIGVGRLGLQY